MRRSDKDIINSINREAERKRHHKPISALGGEHMCCAKDEYSSRITTTGLYPAMVMLIISYIVGYIFSMFADTSNMLVLFIYKLVLYSLPMAAGLWYSKYFYSSGYTLDSATIKQACSLKVYSNFKGILILILIALLGYIAFISSEGCIYSLLPNSYTAATSYTSDYTIGTALSFVLINGVFASICEEIIFRGLIQGFLEHTYSRMLSIILSSLLFTLTHNILGFIPIFIMGITFAILRELTGSIFPSMVLHAITNIGTVISIFTNNSSNGSSTTLPLYAYVSIMVLSIGLLILSLWLSITKTLCFTEEHTSFKDYLFNMRLERRQIVFTLIAFILYFITILFISL